MLVQNRIESGPAPAHLELGISGPMVLAGVDVAEAVVVAEQAGSMAYGLTHKPSFLRGGQRVIDGIGQIVRYGTAAQYIEPVVDEMARNGENPTLGIQADMGTLRAALRDEIAAQRPDLNPTEAARKASALDIARGIGSLLPRVVDGSRPDALPTTRIRAALHTAHVTGLLSLKKVVEYPGGETFIGKFGIGRNVPNDQLMAAAAPELLQLLGFESSDPLMQGAVAHPERLLRFFARGRTRRTTEILPDFLARLPRILQSGAPLSAVMKPALTELRKSGIGPGELAELQGSYDRWWSHGLLEDED